MLDALRQLGFELDISESSHTAIVGGKDGEFGRRRPAVVRKFRHHDPISHRPCALGRANMFWTAHRWRTPHRRTERDASPPRRGVRYVERHGFVPILVHADELPGGLLHVGAAQTSQFLSAILMVSPYARHEVRVDLTDRQTSWPYVTLTMQMMDAFGVTPELIRDPITQEPKTIIVPLGHYVGHKYAIEPDASNASYFLALAAIHPCTRSPCSGLGRQSLQGDVGFAQVLARMAQPWS